MFDKNLNINPLDNHFPEPDIGVDDAWISMQKMLDGAEKRTTILPEGTVKDFKKYWISGIVLLITTGFVLCFLADKTIKHNSINSITSNNLNEKKRKNFIGNDANLPGRNNTNSNEIKNDTLKHLSSKESNKIVTFTNDSVNTDENKSSASKENSSSKLIAANDIKKDSKVFLQVRELEKLNSSNHTIAESNTKSLPEKYFKNAITLNDRFIRFNKQKKIKNSEIEINNEFNKTTATKKTDEIIKNNSYKNNANYKEDSILKIKNRFPILGKAEKNYKNLTFLFKIKITPSIPTTIIVDSAVLDTANKNIKQNEKLKKGDSKGLKKISEILSKNKTSIGLQWNFPIPNGGNYFTGINAQNQPYLLLLPSFWATKMIDKNELMMSFTPLQQNFTINKIMDTVTFPVPVPVPGPVQVPRIVYSSYYRKTQRLLKTFGFSAGLSYNYHVTSSISIGLGLKYNKQNLAIQRDVTVSRITRAQISDTMFVIKESSPDWKYLKPYFISGHLELAYTKRKFSSGLNISAPITNLSVIERENLRPINGQLFLRWKIF